MPEIDIEFLFSSLAITLVNVGSIAKYFAGLIDDGCIQSYLYRIIIRESDLQSNLL